MCMMVQLPIEVILEIETIVMYPHARTFKFQSWQNKKRVQCFAHVIISHTATPWENVLFGSELPGQSMSVSF